MILYLDFSYMHAEQVAAFTGWVEKVCEIKIHNVLLILSVIESESKRLFFANNLLCNLNHNMHTNVTIAGVSLSW